MQSPKTLLVNTLLAKLGLICIPGNPTGNRYSSVWSHFRYSLATKSDSPRSTCRLPWGPISIFSSSVNPPELSSWNWLLLSFSKYSPDCHHLWPPVAANSPGPRLSVIDQDKNSQEFAAKYSKKCWIYHLPAPKWYCFSKSIFFLHSLI